MFLLEVYSKLEEILAPVWSLVLLSFSPPDINHHTCIQKPIIVLIKYSSIYILRRNETENHRNLVLPLGYAYNVENADPF